MSMLYYVHVNMSMLSYIHVDTARPRSTRMSMLNTHSAAASRSSITPPSTRGSSDGGVSDHTGFI